MNFGYTLEQANAAFSAPPPFELGTNALIDQPRVPSAPRSNEEVYREFVAMVKTDASYLQRLAAACQYASPFTRAKPIESLPFASVQTIECAISDRGRGKAKRERWDTGRLRFNTRIQVTTRIDQRLSSPTWSGIADFREPRRARLDADRLHRQKTFSDAYRGFLEEVIAVAEGDYQMVGFLRAETDGQGTPHVDMQVVIASRDGLETAKLETASLITQGPTGLYIIRLPLFDTKTSTGKPLSGSFNLQSRGVRAGLAEKLDWATGELRIVRS